MDLARPDESFDLPVAAGSLRAHRFGPKDGALVLCAPGLSANAKSFDSIATELAAAGHRVVSVDLRGRGHSSVSGAGTYGWKNHASDLLEAATALEATRFSLIGHSMGAFIGMTAARLAPQRLKRLVLIDAVGVPEAASLQPILTAMQRLGAVYPSEEEYLAQVRAIGTVPWDEVWERHYRYDLVPVPGGVRTRTDRSAVFEDIAYGAAQHPPSLWAALAMRTLLVRAGQPLGAGFVVSAADRDRFVATVPRAVAVEVDANHYGIMSHPATAAAIRSFLA